jgi:hypothetical protein
MKRTSVVEHNLYFARARDRGINKRWKPKDKINNNHNTSYNHFTVSILNLKAKTIAPKYWCILNKNAEKINTEINIQIFAAGKNQAD